jgi:hypothetical protein
MKQAWHNPAGCFFACSLPQPMKLCQASLPFSIYFNAFFGLLLHDLKLDEAPARIAQGNPSRNAAPCAVPSEAGFWVGATYRLNRRRPEPKLESEGTTL